MSLIDIAGLLRPCYYAPSLGLSSYRVATQDLTILCRINMLCAETVCHWVQERDLNHRLLYLQSRLVFQSKQEVRWSLGLAREEK